jgi:hypothetical protein
MCTTRQKCTHAVGHWAVHAYSHTHAPKTCEKHSQTHGAEEAYVAHAVASRERGGHPDGLSTVRCTANLEERVAIWPVSTTPGSASWTLWWRCQQKELVVITLVRLPTLHRHCCCCCCCCWLPLRLRLLWRWVCRCRSWGGVVGVKRNSHCRAHEPVPSCPTKLKIASMRQKFVIAAFFSMYAIGPAFTVDTTSVLICCAQRYARAGAHLLAVKRTQPPFPSTCTCAPHCTTPESQF